MPESGLRQRSQVRSAMPASIRVGDNGLRPDFIIGDRFGISAAAALTETAIGLLSAMGYTVAHNKPYAGGFITEHYGRPTRGLHALQIEINRGLYVDETTLVKKPEFDWLAHILGTFFAEFAAHVESSTESLPLAAE